MKQGWEYKKLGEVTSFFRGLTYSGKDEVDFSNNIVLRSNNIDLSTNSINLDELKYISDSITIPEDKKLRKNSIFMCMSNGSKQHLGKVAFVEKEYPYAFGGFMGLIVPNEDKLIPKFTYYYFCSQTFKAYLSSIGNGANINNIKFTDVAKDCIPLPPKPIQLAIVSELDKINELIRLKKEQLKDYDNLAQSIFYEMFGDPVENEMGWEVKKLGEISTSKGGGTPSKNKPEYWNGDIVWVSSKDMKSMYISNSLLHITELGMQNSSAKLLPTGTILIVNRSGILKHTLPIAITTRPVTINQDIKALLVYENKANTLFILYTLKMSSSYLLSKTKAVTVDSINFEEFKKLPIPLPPLPLQQLFAERIKQIEKQKAEVQKAIADLETLLASRMQYWFE